jgi:acetyltransferase-like isoleucine patch superfamily enzyme
MLYQLYLFLHKLLLQSHVSYICRRSKKCGRGMFVEQQVQINGLERMTFGDRVYLGHGTWLDASNQGRIDVGSDVVLTKGVVLAAAQRISIGDHTIIGEYTSIRDSNHGMDPHQSYYTQPLVSAEVHIGTNVWIGRGCLILGGVHLGDNCIIGGNSVVTKSIPANSLAVGSPATVKKMLN